MDGNTIIGEAERLFNDLTLQREQELNEMVGRELHLESDSSQTFNGDTIEQNVQKDAAELLDNIKSMREDIIYTGNRATDIGNQVMEKILGDI